jgi:hypothetical protein
MKKEFKDIIFDFDGVIHQYSGWKGPEVIDGEPVPGIKEAIQEIRKEYRVVIYSTRCNSGDMLRCNKTSGQVAIERWLLENDIKVDEIVNKKVPALLSIDDRTICFDGNSAGLLKKIKKFKVWYK